MILYALRWRHNERDSVWNHQPHDCLLNGLFRRRSKKTSKLHVTGLCVGNSPGPVNSPHKGPVTRKMFPFDDVIMWGLVMTIQCGSKLTHWSLVMPYCAMEHSEHWGQVMTCCMTAPSHYLNYLTGWLSMKTHFSGIKIQKYKWNNIHSTKFI